jgi:serine/threonine protein kinase
LLISFFVPRLDVIHGYIRRSSADDIWSKNLQFVHLQGIVHRDLTPEHILLDWDWNVRISRFGGSNSPDPPGKIAGNPRYRAPECYEGVVARESDVFSFGIILFELAAGRRAFPDEWEGLTIVRKGIMKEDWLPEIPDSVLPGTAELISDCWAVDLHARPSFSKILDRLEEMRFEVVPGVNSRKITEFVNKIEQQEEADAAQE